MPYYQVEGVERNKSPFIKRRRSIICGFCANLSFTASLHLLLHLFKNTSDEWYNINLVYLPRSSARQVQLLQLHFLL